MHQLAGFSQWKNGAIDDGLWLFIRVGVTIEFGPVIISLPVKIKAHFTLIVMRNPPQKKKLSHRLSCESKVETSCSGFNTTLVSNRVADDTDKGQALQNDTKRPAIMINCVKHSDSHECKYCHIHNNQQICARVSGSGHFLGLITSTDRNELVLVDFLSSWTCLCLLVLTVVNTSSFTPLTIAAWLKFLNVTVYLGSAFHFGFGEALISCHSKVKSCRSVLKSNFFFLMRPGRSKLVEATLRFSTQKPFLLIEVYYIELRYQTHPCCWGDACCLKILWPGLFTVRSLRSRSQEVSLHLNCSTSINIVVNL